MKWSKKKPKFNKDSKECLLLVAVKIHGEWEYTLYQIKKYTLYQIKKSEYEEKWYWGIFTAEGNEWGNYADLKADLYCTMKRLGGSKKHSLKS